MDSEIAEDQQALADQQMPKDRQALVAGAAVAPTPAGSPGAAAPQTVKVALFTNIALGDAP